MSYTLTVVSDNHNVDVFFSNPLGSKTTTDPSAHLIACTDYCPGGVFACDVTPSSTTVPRGGVVGLSASVTNNAALARSVSVATNVTLPDGSIYPPSGYLVGPYPLILDAGQTMNGHINLRVPGFAPLGTYTCHGYVIGPAHTYECHCDVTVIAPEAGESGGSSEPEGLDPSDADFVLWGDLLDIGHSGPAGLPSDMVLEITDGNPVGSEASIAFGIPAPTHVRLGVFDVTGRQVVDLIDGHMPEGYHTMVWDGKASDGQSLSPGIYFLRLETDKASLSTKAVVAK
ncbi:MAG: FlgD immunoglobulin-like domain containing protein [Candidatus Eisenbacteria bacterium]